MSTDESKAIAIQYYSVMNGHNLVSIDELVTPDFVMTVGSAPQPLYGAEGFKRLIGMARTAMPDIHFTLADLLAEDDFAIGHWIATGTHSGQPFITTVGTLPAKGHQFRIEGVSWLHITDGKLAEIYVCEDAFSFLSQLGGLPYQKPPTHLTSKEKKEQLVRSFYEVMDQGRIELIDELVTQDFQLRILTRQDPLVGPQGFKMFVTQLRTAIPDIHFQLEHMITEGDKVSARWSNVGTNDHEFLGHPPTGKRISDHGVDIFRITDDGKIAEVLIYDHDLQLMQQLGAAPIAE